ncbi:unnamed protein product [Paramecium primaurelia]|uniref:Uncharacterized protein n=1 Tax=Paramecium primaurelia TaxID=5886 RepID=A0A8S1JQB3_PARPR|nr:unnamed protein product [Paramecium primaurelia]
MYHKTIKNNLIVIINQDYKVEQLITLPNILDILLLYLMKWNDSRSNQNEIKFTLKQNQSYMKSGFQIQFRQQTRLITLRNQQKSNKYQILLIDKQFSIEIICINRQLRKIDSNEVKRRMKFDPQGNHQLIYFQILNISNIGKTFY